ncbi:hypothetical protein [Tritonibacter mobilis]|uniref:hypothetical protein n=1 Tax=Tritonibacter mobilis TaxID=379347 RepID=UPI0039A4EB6A
MANSQTATAEALATSKGALPNRNLSLIGLFGSKNNMQALVRYASGRIETVKTGERLSLGRIVAIDQNGLLIERRGEVGRLPILTN